MSFEHSIQRVMSGEAKGIAPGVLRTGLACIEPIYRAAVSARNRRFDRKPELARRLPRPVISIGNLTTGGTGKTPVIRWLAGRLREEGLAIAILSRGYKSRPGELGDEQQMLQKLLGTNRPGKPPIYIEAHPDRYATGLRLLERDPSIEVFLLDDGFQHRKLRRDMDVVLLHAGEPFGFGHVLPRGLLREPIRGLARASAVVLTNAADPFDATSTVKAVRQFNAHCAIVHERHEPIGFRSAIVSSDAPPDVAVTALKALKAFCFSGLGLPGGFESGVRRLAGQIVGVRRFRDHHAYTPGDVQSLQAEATTLGAELLVTTEKDWAKLESLDAAKESRIPIWRLDVAAVFTPADETLLFGQVMQVVNERKESSPARSLAASQA